MQEWKQNGRKNRKQKTRNRFMKDDWALNKFLEPFLAEKDEREKFIQWCNKRLKTLRALLSTQYYIEVADSIEAVRPHRIALQLIFFVSLAQGIIKQKFGKKLIKLKKKIRKNKNVNDIDVLKEFFRYSSEEDKKILVNGIRRSLGEKSIHKLKFSSIIKILYNERCKAVHGDGFWDFLLMTEQEKEESKKYTSYSFLTSGELGKKNRKRSVSLEVGITYNDLRNIIISTALKNIKSF